MVDGLTRHDMVSPQGTTHMVLERDRRDFEKRGYRVFGAVQSQVAPAAPPPAVAAAEAPPSAPQPPAPVAPAPAPHEARKPLSRMNHGELVALAGTLGITDLEGTNPQLIERIKQAEAAAVPPKD